MEQYNKNGPPTEKVKQDKQLQQRIEGLQQQVGEQEQRIKNLERDLRKLRNSMRVAVSTFNINKSDD